MKEIMSLVRHLGIVLRCVLAALKPDVVIAVTGPSKPGYCNTKASPTLACGSLIFAAALRPDVGQRQ